MVYNSTESLLRYLRSIMTIKNIKSKELAEKLNISESALSARFTQDNISLKVLLEMCEALDFEVDIDFIDKSNINKQEESIKRRIMEYSILLKELQEKEDTN